MGPGDTSTHSDGTARRAEFDSLETGQIPVVLDPVRVRIPSEIWTLLGATFFVAVGFGLVVPVLPQYAESFGVNATLVALVVSAFAFMRLVAAPVAGRLVDRFGERRLYSLGMLIVAASSFATAFAGDYFQLLLFRGLGGVGSVMFTLAAASMVVKYTPQPLRARVSSLWAGLFLIGGILGPFFGGMLAHLGLAVPFIWYGAALLVAAAIVGIALRSTRVRSGAGARSLPAMRFAEAIPRRDYQASLAFAFANGWAVMGMRIAVVPLFVAALLPDEPFAVGAAVAISAAANAAALQWAGRASDRRGRRPLILAGLTVTFLGLVVFAVTGALWAAFVAAAIVGFGSGLAAPASQAALADIIGQERSGGKVLAAFQMAQDAGQILGPIIAGGIIDLVGYSWSFLAAAVIVAVPFVFWWSAPETLQRASRG